MPNPFTVPDGGRTYTKTVIDKARLLIVKGIWDEIDELDFDRWLSNFKTDEEKYFSACLLDASLGMCSSKSLRNDSLSSFMPTLNSSANSLSARL